jgi:hypothetical protein
MLKDLSSLYLWTVQTSVVSATSGSEVLIKTFGMPVTIDRIIGSVYNQAGAVLPTMQARDRIWMQIESQDTNQQIGSGEYDLFNMLRAYEGYPGPRFTLPINTTIRFTFRVDTQTNLFAGQYPLRIELDFFGVRGVVADGGI